VAGGGGGGKSSRNITFLGDLLNVQKKKGLLRESKKGTIWMK